MEATSNLDQDNVLRVEDLVANYRDTQGAAVVWVTHDPLQAARVASRRLLLNDDGSAEQKDGSA